MTPMKKPEWFQMAEADGPRQVRKVKRGARIVALIAPLLLVGVGVVVAQSNDGGPALAVETKSPVVPASQKLTAQTNTTPQISQMTTQSVSIKAPTGRNSDDEGFEGDDD